MKTALIVLCVILAVPAVLYCCAVIYGLCRGMDLRDALVMPIWILAMLIAEMLGQSFRM